MMSALDAARLFAQSAASFGSPHAAGPAEIEWLSENRSIAELTTMSLRAFAPYGDDRIPVLIEAPFAIHDAGIIDLSRGHSIVEAFRAGSGRRLAVTSWHSATAALSDLTIDSYLSDLNVAVDLLGGQVDLVGLCQGGWMALVYAATFPHKVRRLVLAGTPADTEAASSFVTCASKNAANPWLQPFVAGAGLINTGSLFYALIAAVAQDDSVAAALQVEQRDMGTHSDAVARFLRWNWRNYNLPAGYFRQVERWLFQDNRIVKGTFPVFGSPVGLAHLRCPLFILAADRDDYAPPGQSLGLGAFVGTPGSQVVARVAPDCTHLGLFLGRRTLRDVWPEVFAFLNAD
jgi:poly(3-hydroxyalkanoate) synthetase